MRVYLAGPLFTPYQRGFLDQFAARLRDRGIEVDDGTPWEIGMFAELLRTGTRPGATIGLMTWASSAGKDTAHLRCCARRPTHRARCTPAGTRC